WKLVPGVCWRRGEGRAAAQRLPPVLLLSDFCDYPDRYSSVYCLWKVVQGRKSVHLLCAAHWSGIQEMKTRPEPCPKTGHMRGDDRVETHYMNRGNPSRRIHVDIKFDKD